MPEAVTLAAVLGARTAGLSEPEIWSLLCQAAQALQDLFLAKRARENAPRVSPTSLRLTSRGRVTLLPDVSVPWPPADSGDRYWAPEYGGGPLLNTSEVDIEKMWIFSLGQSLREAVNADKVELTRPLDNLLTVMTRADSRQRATLMDVLNVISDFCKVRVDCKPFSHVAMDLYRETLGISPRATPCLPDTPAKDLDRKTIACNGEVKLKGIVGKSCSLKEPRPRMATALRRAPSHLYGDAIAPTARYACPNTRIGPEFVVRATEPVRTVHFAGKKGGGKKARGVIVVLLDGQRLDVRCDTGAVTAGQLLEVVLQVHRIEENFFLGLTALLDGDLFFLCPDTRLNKVATRTPGCSLTLHLRVKFYLPSLRGINRWASKHLLYLQLRRCLLERQIRCETSEMLVLGGLALQAEFGDAGEGGEYFLLEHYVPEAMLDESGSLVPALRAQHQRRRGLDPGRAEEMFVSLAQGLDAYGLHFYAATRVGRNDSRTDMWLAVGGSGVALYDKRGADRTLHRLYAWRDIDRLCYSKCYFVLHPRADVRGVIPIKYKFQLDQNKCLFVFHLASQHHQFFLKLRVELSSLHSLSCEFGLSLTNLGKKNRKLFYVENHRPTESLLGNAVRGLMPSPKHCSQTSLSGVGTSSLDTSINIEEHQNKENEQPAFRRLNTDLVIMNNSLECKAQHTQCLPCYVQYPGDVGPYNVKRTNSNPSSFPRRGRVKMGTRAISSVPKELSASQDTHTSLSSACSYVPTPSSPPCSPPPVDHVGPSPDVAPPLPCSPPPSTPTPFGSSPPETYVRPCPNDAPPLPSSSPPSTPPPPLSPPPEAYVLDSSIRSSDETFRLDVDESLSDSLADRFDEMSFADERILRAFRFARDGVRITEGSDGGVYVRSGGRSPLRPGDQLVAVDGRSLLRMKYRDALDFLRTRGAELDVVVSRAFLGGGDEIAAVPTGMRAVCCVLPNQ